jgi:hypothetical protein
VIPERGQTYRSTALRNRRDHLSFRGERLLCD